MLELPYHEPTYLWLAARKRFLPCKDFKSHSNLHVPSVLYRMQSAGSKPTEPLHMAVSRP